MKMVPPVPMPYCCKLYAARDHVPWLQIGVNMAVERDEFGTVGTCVLYQQCNILVRAVVIPAAGTDGVHHARRNRINRTAFAREDIHTDVVQTGEIRVAVSRS